MTNGRWLAMTFLLLFGALGAGVAIVFLGIRTATAADFMQTLTTPYGRVQDYAFNLEHEDCEVLIYGDSSALTSDDPVMIEAQTHLKTCNISQTLPVVSVMGTEPVDLYLMKNKPPRYLLIQLSPDLFYVPHRLDKEAAFDPLTVMLRHNQGLGTTRALLQFPVQTVRYVSLVIQDRYRPDRAKVAAFNSIFEKAISDYYASHGFMTLPKPVQTECVFHQQVPFVPVDHGWVDEARRRYGAMGIKVLVNVSPIPDCDPRHMDYQRELTPYVDAEVRWLPISYFNDADRHFTLEGAKLISAGVVRQIVAKERQGE